MKSQQALILFIANMRNKGYAKSTLIRCRRDVLNFLMFSRQEDVREIGKNHITEYQTQIHESGQYGIDTQYGIMKTIQGFFRFLVRNEYLLINPFANLDLSMQRVRRQRESIAEEKLCRFLDSIDGNSFMDLRDRALFELLYGTGLRLGEARNLDISDLDENAGSLLVREGKGKRDRMVPVGKNALINLRRYIDSARSELKGIENIDALFVSYRGNRLTSGIVEHLLRKQYGKLFPGEKITPHMLRHSFATHLLEAGVGIKQVKDMLGHRAIESTVLYTHFTIMSRKKFMKRFHPRENEMYEEDVLPREYDQ